MKYKIELFFLIQSVNWFPVKGALVFMVKVTC